MISIFNDVIGPVMRGPSSSHCAAALRIGRLARDLMDGVLKEVRVEFDENGSLATTHESHGSDMGFFGGLLGWPATDERLPNSREAIRAAGVNVLMSISLLNDPHPNAFHMTLLNDREQHTMTALSTGGGIIEVIEVDGFSLSMKGDFYETLICMGSDGKAAQELLAANGVNASEIVYHDGKENCLVEIKANRFLDDKEIASLQNHGDLQYVKRLAPVLPVHSRKDMEIPFTRCSEMEAYNENRNLPLWELAAYYECLRGDLSREEVMARMKEIVRTVRISVKQGIEGTVYKDRILGYQCGEYNSKMKNGQLLDSGMLNRITLYVTALMEVKSAMGVIVAAPTAGSCGAFPGACIAAADYLDLTDENAAKAMLAGGLIGVFIAAQSTFAAEIAGCQAECGAGSGMAAAALVSLAGGTTQQALGAASMALQNSFGMTCDPVANRVEAPCLGKNVMAAANALVCANMSLADYDPVVPLDEVIETMDRVGRSLPRELRCTALGGLSLTKTSMQITEQLKQSRK